MSEIRCPNCKRPLDVIYSAGKFLAEKSYGIGFKIEIDGMLCKVVKLEPDPMGWIHYIEPVKK